MSENTEVDFSAFEAEVDRVVEAAAQRDAELAEIDAQHRAFVEDIYERKAALNKQLRTLGNRETTAARVRDQRVAAASARFVEATNGLDDEPPFVEATNGLDDEPPF